MLYSYTNVSFIFWYGYIFRNYSLFIIIEGYVSCFAHGVDLNIAQA